MTTSRRFNAAEMRALASALADSSGGLTNSNIDDILAECGLIGDRREMESKRNRLARAFDQNQ